MIDVVFLLIIFFLVASYFVRSEQSRPVSLPDANKGQPDDVTSQHRLTITVEKDGRYSIAGQLLSEANVLDRIRELGESASTAPENTIVPEVRIRSDRDARFSEIRRLIEQCASRNIRSIRFAVATPVP